ncbi:O-methyltransferase [Advenella alkanexedens]|uniref:O-methyltransferase n=1 Tax=Advenella alkanexedens TaxID=1481665 RepID=UPI0026774986|nr:O-methyltransferase [Advenella alkanexedens]WKU20338.1 O-methyltransferase [Advenella alkanexedens]
MTKHKTQITEECYKQVDDYFNQLFLKEDVIPEKVLEHCKKNNIPAINVAPNQGKLLHMLVSMNGARRVLEIGTLGAYSTVWMGLALPDDGRLVTLDFDENYIKIARESLSIAGLQDKVEIRQGVAADTLAQMVQEQQAPFDFIFIDADKENNPVYLEYALKLSRPGTVIVADNVVRQAKILDDSGKADNIRGLRRFFDDMVGNHRLTVTAFQTLGSKGWDGLAIAIVKQ